MKEQFNTQEPYNIPTQPKTTAEQMQHLINLLLTTTPKHRVERVEGGLAFCDLDGRFQGKMTTGSDGRRVYEHADGRITQERTAPHLRLFTPEFQEEAKRIALRGTRFE